MSDCIDFTDMLTEVGGWGIPVCLGGEATGETATEGGFHFEQINDAPTNITSNVSSQSSAEQIGAQFNDNSAQDNETLEPKEQVNEESVSEKIDQVMQQAWTESKEPTVVSQTGQDHAQQKGFFNKWVIGGLAVGTVAAAAVITAFFKNRK